MNENKAGLRILRDAIRRAVGVAALLSATSALNVGTAQAQGTPPAERAASALEEVTVTARRREESAQDVPIAITAVNAETLQNLKVENLENLQTVVPALSVSAASGRPNAPVYGLRGIRPTEAIYGQDPTVAVYFADFVLSPSQGSNLGIFDLSSVQVLKGPQGTLFGRNTIGGAILFAPRRPGEEFGGDAMIGFGNFGRSEAQLGVDIPASDAFAMRFAARMIDSDGYQRNVAQGPLYGSKLGGEDTRNLRLSTVLDITDSVENYTVFSWDAKQTNGRGMVLQALNRNPTPADGNRVLCYDGPTNPNGSPISARTGLPICGAETIPLPSIFDALARAQGRDVTDIESDIRQYDDIEVWSIINTTTASLSDDLTLKTIAGFRDFESFSTIDLDSSAVPGILTAGSNAPGVLKAPEQHVTLEHGSLEVQLLGEAFDRLNWVTGLYGYYEKGFEFSPGDVNTLITPATNPFMQRGDVENYSYSIFAQGTFNFTPQWALTAGVRWNYDEKEMTLSSKVPVACALRNPATDVFLPLNACQITLNETFEQPTGTVSLDWKPTDGMLIYLASRYGYRAGGFNLRATRGPEYEPFDAETVLDAELGTKLDWSAGIVNMRTNLAVFHQWYDDIQRTVAATNSSGVPGSAVQNAAKAKVFGVELEQTIAPTENISLQINYSYTDPKYDEWIEPASGSDLSKTPFHFTPEHSGSAHLSYKVPMAAAGELRFTAGTSYRSGVWINSLQNINLINATPRVVWPALRQEAYWLYDLGLGWSNIMETQFDVSAYVKNVSNEEYTLGGIQLYPTFGLTTKAYGEPRTYGMEVRYKF